MSVIEMVQNRIGASSVRSCTVMKVDSIIVDMVKVESKIR
jgi:hypothetical protein